MRLFLIPLLFATATVNAGEVTHYLDLVNTAQDSITSFASASAGSGRFLAVQIGDHGALQGGGTAVTIAIAAVSGRNGCLQDLRLGFANGRVLIQNNFDVCKYRSYHVGRYLRGAAQTVIAAVP